MGERYTADPKNIIVATSKINKQPKAVSELYTLLGLFNSFWRSIRNFSKIATPFYDLLKNWLNNGNLITSQKNTSLLAYPDFEQTFVHHIDASGQGFDCPLFEQQNGQLMILVLAVGH